MGETENKKSKKSTVCILSFAALIISATTFLLNFIRIEPFSFSMESISGFTVGLMGVCATVIVGSQIYNSIETKNKISDLEKELNEKIDNELKQPINHIFDLQDQINELQRESRSSYVLIFETLALSNGSNKNNDFGNYFLYSVLSVITEYSKTEGRSFTRITEVINKIIAEYKVYQTNNTELNINIERITHIEGILKNIKDDDVDLKELRKIIAEIKKTLQA